MPPRDERSLWGKAAKDTLAAGHSSDRAWGTSIGSLSRRRRKAADQSAWGALPRYLLSHAAQSAGLSAAGHNFELIERLQTAGHEQPPAELVAQAADEAAKGQAKAAQTSRKRKAAEAMALAEGARPRPPVISKKWFGNVAGYDAALAKYEQELRKWKAKQAAQKRREKKEAEEEEGGAAAAAKPASAKKKAAKPAAAVKAATSKAKSKTTAKRSAASAASKAKPKPKPKAASAKK